MSKESLKFLPLNKWAELQAVFRSDWPRCIQGYAILDFQRQLVELGLDYGFEVYCPYGDISNGMVALNKKVAFEELTIVCPKDDTSVLERALRDSKVIDWKRKNGILFLPDNVFKLTMRIIEDMGREVDVLLTLNMFIYHKDRSLFDISLPSDLKFDYLKYEHLELLDSSWPHRYPGSMWYFKLLIDAKVGYGLFKNYELVAWCLLRENGALGHLYTAENHRKKGYGLLMLKLMSNINLQQKKDVFAYCVVGNSVAYQMYTKLGFENRGTVTSIILKCEESTD